MQPVLQDLLPKIAARFNTNELYLVGHSKGALDIQGAMIDQNIADLIKAVFSLSGPNQGTELADWAFENNGNIRTAGFAEPGR